MKKYIAPTIETYEVNTTQLIAVSQQIGNLTIGGGQNGNDYDASQRRGSAWSDYEN